MLKLSVTAQQVWCNKLDTDCRHIQQGQSMKSSSGLQVPLCHHGVAEIVGLAGLGRRGVSQKSQCVSVANAARLGLTSQTPELCISMGLLVVILLWWILVSKGDPVLRIVGSQEKDCLFLLFV